MCTGTAVVAILAATTATGAASAGTGRGLLIGGHGGHFYGFHLRNNVFITQGGPDLLNGQAGLLKVLVVLKLTFFYIYFDFMYQHFWDHIRQFWGFSRLIVYTEP